MTELEMNTEIQVNENPGSYVGYVKWFNKKN